MRLLVTRPKPEGERTAQRLRSMGHEVWLSPVMRIVPLGAPQWPQECMAIAVTSANALHVMRQAPGLSSMLARPLLAVGEQTAAMARSLGFTDVHSAAGNARDLAREVADLPQGARLYHPVGRDRRERLEELVKPAHVSIKVETVYEAEAMSGLTANVVAGLEAGSLDGVLHYSPRSAALFLTLCEKAGCLAVAQALRHFCLSNAIADMLHQHGARHTLVSERPDENALLALVMSCPKPE